jgi:hypothetical protein
VFTVVHRFLYGSDSAEALDIGTGKLFFCIAFLCSVFHCTSLSCIVLREDFVDRTWKKRSDVASSDANVFFAVRLSYNSIRRLDMPEKTYL